MEKFIEAGFEVVNSFYEQTYVDLNGYLTAEKMKHWNAYQTPDGNRISDRILGGEGCAWEFGNAEEYPFYAYTIAASIAVLGDKLWDRSDREHTQAYRAALSEYLFGTDALTCVFDAIGDLVPPRKVDIYVAKWAPMPSVVLVEECLAKLRAVENRACLETRNQYVAFFERLLEQRKACENA